MRKKRFRLEFVTAFPDRHGKVRYRFRKKGVPSVYLKGEPGSPEFLAEYRAALTGKNEALPVGAERIVVGTMHDLIARYYRSAKWANKSEAAQKHDRYIIERFRKTHGGKRVAAIKYEHVDAILAKMAVTPTAANKLRKQLKVLMQHAIACELITVDPMAQTVAMKIRGDGYHTWTEDEIDLFYAKHERGTKARLAMDLMLWTGQRRGDMLKMTRDDIKDGRIAVLQGKTDTYLRLPIPEQLLETITAMPVRLRGPFLVTAYGRPFSEAGFGNWFRARCDEAGLRQCSSHGLRKAMARRLAEINESNQSIKSITGHKTDSEVSRYTRDAEQSAMADAAMARLSAWEKSNRAKRLDTEQAAS